MLYYWHQEDAKHYKRGWLAPFTQKYSSSQGANQKPKVGNQAKNKELIKSRNGINSFTGERLL